LSLVNTARFDRVNSFGLTMSARVLACVNRAFHGDFQPPLAKASESVSFIDVDSRHLFALS
jgi:hypothetical protein